MAASEHRQLLAVIPIPDTLRNLAFSRVHGESLVKRVAKAALCRPEIETIIISDSSLPLRETFHGEERIVLLDGRQLDFDDCSLSSSPLKVLRKVLAEYAQTGGEWADRNGIILLDPRCVYQSSEPLFRAVDKYFSQQNKDRPWLSVVSVDNLPNHFHPLKVLKQKNNGSLSHLDDLGRKIFQRQQLDDDPYYYWNGAYYIIDPVRLTSDSDEDDETIGVIGDDSLIFVENEKDLLMAESILSM